MLKMKVSFNWYSRCHLAQNFIIWREHVANTNDDLVPLIFIYRLKAIALPSPVEEVLPATHFLHNLKQTYIGLMTISVLILP